MMTAFFLTMCAGMATMLGSVITVFVKPNHTQFLAGSLGFASGVMLFVSFADIWPEANGQIAAYFGEPKLWYGLLPFLGGSLLVLAMELLLPAEEEISVERTGKLTALVLALHNFPEGMATFTASVANPVLGIGVACAIALHNIPEGIAVSVPLYYADGNRKRAMALSALSGLSEPLGALGAYTLLHPLLNGRFMGMLLAAVAGIMVMISLCELLPNAWQYGHKLAVNIGLMFGMAFMGIGQVLFAL